MYWASSRAWGIWGRGGPNGTSDLIFCFLPFFLPLGFPLKPHAARRALSVSLPCKGSNEWTFLCGTDALTQENKSYDVVLHFCSHKNFVTK